MKFIKYIQYFVQFRLFFNHFRFLAYLFIFLYYDKTMKNLKENNIQKTLWHIKRHCSNIENNNENEYRKTELFHLKSSIEILTRILNNENPYPNLDREEVF